MIISKFPKCLSNTLAMTMFLSGPPGGQTLPQTATRLSDLDGGVFGPGASVASTGINVIKPAVKAGLAQSAGETWDDVLEYYIVRFLHLRCRSLYLCESSSMPTEVKKTLRINWGRSITRAASTLLRVVLVLARRGLDAFRRISIKLSFTSFRLHGRSGLVILRTPYSILHLVTRPKASSRLDTHQRARLISGGCISAARA